MLITYLIVDDLKRVSSWDFVWRENLCLCILLASLLLHGLGLLPGLLLQCKSVVAEVCSNRTCPSLFSEP